MYAYKSLNNLTSIYRIELYHLKLLDALIAKT